MEINVVRLSGSHPRREPVDTTLLLGVEFMLGEGHCITIRVVEEKVNIYSSHGRLQILPETANSISVRTIV